MTKQEELLVHFELTSYIHDKLYPNRLASERFLSIIEAIDKYFIQKRMIDIDLNLTPTFSKINIHYRICDPDTRQLLIDIHFTSKQPIKNIINRLITYYDITHQTNPLLIK